jgi:hypothetical protein
VLGVGAGLIPRSGLAEDGSRRALPNLVTPHHEPPPFEQINEDGFGECLNSYSWSMTWFKGSLYVGTNKGSFLQTIGWIDPDYDCEGVDPEKDPAAEIWKYSPETKTWEMVFLSPTDVPVWGQPGVFTARDNGFRDLMVYTEADGTEALYAGGVIYPFLFETRRPRILRSTDGVNFEAIPQEPGTYLGDLNVTTYRAMAQYKGRFYITAGSVVGEGIILESSNPSEGNDSFRVVTPPGMLAFELIPWNDHLYIGSGEASVGTGFRVMKTDAEPNGTPFYDFETVVPDGAYGRYFLGPNNAVLSMAPFGGRLYVGGQNDMVRINPDDTWELVVGDARDTPTGPMHPISGFGQGFGNWFTGHFWRMETHDDTLWVGTWDVAVHFRIIPLIGPLIDAESGFDLWSTEDGVSWTQVTRNGLDSKFNPGVRGLESTPFGLYLGTTNPYDGTQVYGPKSEPPPDPFAGQLTSAADPASLAAPHRLEGESQGRDTVLSWETSAGATEFRIFRAAHSPNRELGVRELPRSAWVVGPYVAIGTTTQPFYRDSTALNGRRYNYYVQAVAKGGGTSEASNLVMVPSVGPAVTFGTVQAKLADLARRKQIKPAWSQGLLSLYLAAARTSARRGDAVRAERFLEAMIRQTRQGAMEPFVAEDLQMLLGKLLRRVRLAQSGAIPMWDLIGQPAWRSPLAMGGGK